MSLFKTLTKGAAMTASSYRLILLIWVTTLIVVAAVGFPLKSFLNIIFGHSLAMERFADGFDLGLTGDIGRPFTGLTAAAAAGAILLSLAGFVIMTFFTGGLFQRFATAWGGLKVSEFLRASAKNFIPFLKISLLMIFITGAYTLILIGVPLIVIAASSGSEMDGMGLIYPFVAIWALGIPIWLFVADASRRWMAATGSRRIFRAVVAGFRALKERFWLSYSTVLIILLANCVFVAIATWIAALATPGRGMMIFLFFILTQVLVIIRIFIKAWRFASVCETAAYPSAPRAE